MALLSAQELLGVRALVAKTISEERLDIAGFTKTDLGAAVAAIDSFFDSNSAAINNAIPEPAKSALTARQKALLVVLVIRKRYNV